MAAWHRQWESSRDRSSFALGFSSALVTDVFLDLSRSGFSKSCEWHGMGIVGDFLRGNRMGDVWNRNIRVYVNDCFVMNGISGTQICWQHTIDGISFPGIAW